MNDNDGSPLAPDGQHPPADRLADFAEGTLPFEDVQQIRRHLKVCAECHHLIRDLSSYPNLEPPSEPYQVSAEELRTNLGALRARVLDPSMSDRPSGSGDVAVKAPEPEARGSSSETVAVAKVVERPAVDVRPSPRVVAKGRDRRWQPLLAAAVIFLALGWGWQRGIGAKRLQAEVMELRNRLATAEAELRRPWVNVRVTRLLAGDDPLRSSPASPFSLGRTGNFVLIQTPEPLPTGRYTGEIRSPTGKVIRRIEDLEPQKIGLALFLPPRALEPGEYRLWLLRDGAEVYPTPFELRVPE